LLLSEEADAAEPPFTLETALNPKNQYHAFVRIMLNGKKAGGVNVFFSPKKRRYTITTDKSKDDGVNLLYDMIKERKNAENSEKTPLEVILPHTEKVVPNRNRYLQQDWNRCQ